VAVQVSDHYKAVEKLHNGHRTAIRGQRVMLEAIAEAEIRRIWIEDGCRDLAHWVSVEIGIKWWDAQRWINAVHALPHLPQISAAWDDGELDIAKVVELCRFATPETEAELIPWARRVAVSTRTLRSLPRTSRSEGDGPMPLSRWPWHTTSSTGWTAARPTWATSRSYAPSTTSSFTNTAGPLSWTTSA
jgi:hypothetical protein